MNQSRRRTRCRNHDGFIVVAVLWILSALATLASVYSIYVANIATSLAVNDDALRAEALVQASLELTAYRAMAREREDRPSRGTFAFRMNAADVSVEFCSEAARIDLNSASKELLAGLFRVLGASDGDHFADRIIGWRSVSRSGSQDEVSLYQAAGLGYGPRGAPFAHVGELALVVGLPPALVERAMPHVTVYSGGSKINVRDASAEVISALPGMTPDLLEAVLADRHVLANGSLPQLRPIRDDVTIAASKAMRVKILMSVFNGRTITSEAVILLDDGSEPYRVLSWEMDTGAPRNSSGTDLVTNRHERERSRGRFLVLDRLRRCVVLQRHRFDSQVATCPADGRGNEQFQTGAGIERQGRQHRR
jgi:general secretion pathway protein K